MDIRNYICEKFPGKSPNSAGEIHGNCPFHDDQTKSFSINVSTGVFICGSTKCSVRGNFFLFYKMIEQIDSWTEVYNNLSKPSLAPNIGDLFTNKKKKKDSTVINNFPQPQFLSDIYYIEYLERRGITRDVCNRYELKYGVGGKFDKVDITNTIVAPIFDIDGTYRTFQARALDDYRLRWNTPEHSPIQFLLYGGWVDPPKNGFIMIVEGASDVWNMASKGLYAVGLFTSHASNPQLMKIAYLCESSNSIPVVLLDGDACIPQKPNNKIAAKDLYSELFALGLSPRWVPLEKEEDPGGMSIERVKELESELMNGCQAVFEGSD